MFMKLIIVVLCVFGLSSRAHDVPGGHHHHNPDNQFTKEICSTETNVEACNIVASRCLFQPPVSASTTFCSCVSSVTGVSSIYSAWVQAEHDGQDLCVEESHGGSFPEAHGASTSGGVEHISFNDYLKNQNAALETQLECCVGKARGLFDNSGKAIITAWTENTALISDVPAKTAVVNSITQCASTNTACSAHDFMHCVLEKCYQTLKTTTT